MEINSAQPCEICGDIGYAKDIATCSKCRKTREHIYCMHPKLFNVPRSWHCEACRRDNVDRHDTCNSDSLRRCLDEKGQGSSKRQRTWATRNVLSKVPDPSTTMCSPSTVLVGRMLPTKFVPKKVETRKIKLIPVEECGAKRKPSYLCGGSSSNMRSRGINHRPIPKRSSALKDHAHKSAIHPKPLTVDKVHTNTLRKHAVEVSQTLHGLRSPSYVACKVDTLLPKDNVGKAEPVNAAVCCDKVHTSILQKQAVEVSQTLHSLKSPSYVAREVDTLLPKDNVCKEEPVNAAICCDKVHTSTLQRQAVEVSQTLHGLKSPSYVACEVDTLLPKDNVCKEGPVNAAVCCDEDETSNLNVPFKLQEEDLANPPAVNASWKGNFQINDFSRELCGGVHAYPARRVSRKAYIVSKQMPRVLQFILQPRLDVWPEIFQTVSPSGFDIALYFWADNFCREKYNRLLVLMDEKNLSLRSRLNGVDLLIFTSRQLPIESQRMNMQFYLWGVFRPLEGQHFSVNLSGKQHEFTLPLHNRNIGENSTSIAHKVGHQVVDMEIDVVLGEEDKRADKSLRTNSAAASEDDSQDLFPVMFSHQPVESIAAGHLHDTQKEHYEDYVAPPGFSRPIAGNAIGEGPITTPPMGFSHLAHKVDAPGLSKSAKLIERDIPLKVNTHGSRRDSIEAPSVRKNGIDQPWESNYASHGNYDCGTDNGEIMHREYHNAWGGSKETKGRQDIKLLYMEQTRGSPTSSTQEFHSNHDASGAKIPKLRHREKYTAWVGSKKAKRSQNWNLGHTEHKKRLPGSSAYHFHSNRENSITRNGYRETYGAWGGSKTAKGRQDEKLVDMEMGGCPTSSTYGFHSNHDASGTKNGEVEHREECNARVGSKNTKRSQNWRLGHTEQNKRLPSSSAYCFHSNRENSSTINGEIRHRETYGAWGGSKTAKGRQDEKLVDMEQTRGCPTSSTYGFHSNHDASGTKDGEVEHREEYNARIGSKKTKRSQNWELARTEQHIIHASSSACYSHSNRENPRTRNGEIRHREPYGARGGSKKAEGRHDEKLVHTERDKGSPSLSAFDLHPDNDDSGNKGEHRRIEKYHAWGGYNKANERKDEKRGHREPKKGDGIYSNADDLCTEIGELRHREKFQAWGGSKNKSRHDENLLRMEQKFPRFSPSRQH